tara:strand:- start:35 stop:760 length:726 start_codon:yes stop_codon:yes gene_type:complete
MKLTIEQTIANMLTENTGSHMLDSGGSNGRNWQRNKDKTVEYFKSLPSATADIYYSETHDSYDISPCVNIFHLLTGGVLELDGLCHEFNAIEVGQWSDVYNGVCWGGVGFLNEHDFENVDNGFNTYNWASNHSQVMQGNMLERDGEQYILLQIHGGADVRGGYTDAKLFKLDHHADFWNVVNENCGFSCPKGEHSISWHGELINDEGGCADDDDIKALALACGCNADNPSITIEGYAYLDY